MCEILRSKVLDPGHAGKLKGKLMFAEGQLFGRYGRSLLRALSERQYSKIWVGELNEQLEVALRGWLMILGGYAVPRKIREERDNFADAVAFTDGWWPELATSQELPMTGFVLYDKRYAKPVYAMSQITKKEMEKWLPRKTQIVLVEMFAVVQLIASCGEKLRKKRLLLTECHFTSV